MHLDMNPHHTGFLFTAIDDLPAQEVQVAAPDAGDGDPPRPLHRVRAEGLLLRDGARPDAAGAGRGDAVGGRRGRAAAPALDAGDLVGARRTARGQRRAPRRRAGPRDVARPRGAPAKTPAASPLRELTGDDAQRVLFAVGAGVAAEKQPARPRDRRTPRRPRARRRRARACCSSPTDGSLVAGAAPTMAPSTVDAHAISLELPVLVWDGVAQPVTAGAVARRCRARARPRAAASSSRAARFASAAPLAEALVRAGCTRAAAPRPRRRRVRPFLDAPGSASPPRARYDETVLYAVCRADRAARFRFEAQRPPVAPRLERTEPRSGA